VRAYLYIVAATQDPNRVTCPVPYKIEDQPEIFFGPCKKRLRQDLRREFLADNKACKPTEDIYLIGFNGANAQRCRKIVWAGKVERLMTFAEADRSLTAAKYQKFRNWPETPLHLRRRTDGRSGYEHVGTLHSGDWLADIVSSAKPAHVNSTEAGLTVDSCTSWPLDRDLCMLLSNICFAGDGFPGIDINDELLAILISAQSDRCVDKYSVFGKRKNGTADGRTGSWLSLVGSDAEQFVDCLKGEVQARSRALGNERRSEEIVANATPRGADGQSEVAKPRGRC